MRSSSFTEADLQLLNAVAGQAGIAVENARLYKVAVEKGRLERELQMARELQESLLPRKMPLLSTYEVAARWRSAREVAGDFYDLFILDDDALGLLIADVSDKGAPAALFMASARSMIRSHAFSGLSPVDTLSRTNDLMLEDAESGMFVTVFYSILRKDGWSIHVNAGHNPPMLYRHEHQKVHLLPRGGRAIGWFPENPLRSIELQLQPGDVIVYYTDGLTDAENADGEPFGEERLANAVWDVRGDSAELIMDHIVDQVDTFCGSAPAFDDLTLCVVRCKR
jgi:sigma-B regulation protein RsbU (phosphoserine phosphatase)